MKKVFDARATTGASESVDTGASRKTFVHVYRKDAAAAGTASVLVQQSADNAAWTTKQTVTNPTGLDATNGAGGTWVELECAPFTRLFMASLSAGTYDGLIHAEKN